MAKDVYESGMTPVNKIAGRVVSKGTEYSPKLKPWAGTEQKTPFPVRQLQEIPHNLRHLIGYRFGRMTVMGFSHIPKRWSVRCACGVYCIRTTKAICNDKNINDACRECRDLQFQLRREHYLKTGKEIEPKDLPSGIRERAPLPPHVIGGPRYTPHHPDRSAEAPTRKAVPLHWTEEQRAVPTTLATALSAVGLGRNKKD